MPQAKEKLPEAAGRLVRIGVVGTGVMGQNHLRVYDGLKDAVLVGIYDPDHEKAAALATQYNCTAFSSQEKMAECVDAVSICSPSTTHHQCGLLYLDRNIHCMIEKPLATTRQDCLELIDRAKQSGVKLLVGHIERFNPAIQQVFSLLQQGAKIQAIEARRLSSVSGRIKDVDVVMDLMVHDLDIILALAQSEIQTVSASQVRTESSSGGDYVTGLLDFANGVSATVTASRISQNPVRCLTVTTDQGTVVIDYQNQSADVFLKSSTINRGGEFAPFGQYASGITMENIQIRRQEPLQLELAHFIDIIKNDGDAFVTGQQGLAALELVWEIQKIIGAKTGD